MLKVLYVHTCDECKNQKIEEYTIDKNSLIPKPCIPKDWTVINGNTLICNKHKIEVKITNKMENKYLK